MVALVLKRIIPVIILLFAINAFGASTAKQVDFLAAGIEKDGDACSGCKVYTYETGTTTAKATYLDRAKASPATNPIILDSEGRAEVFADGLYKMVIKTAADASYFDIDGLDYGGTSINFTTLSQYAGLSEAIADAGAINTTIIIDTTDTLNASLTIPANITLFVVEPDAIALNGKTLTMNGSIVAPPIIWLTGTGTFTGSPIVQFYDSTWTASTLTDSATPSYKNLILSEPTLLVPVVSDFSNATHIHNSVAQGGVLPLPVRDSSRGLAITNTSEEVVSITATEAILQDASGASLKLSSISTSVDITNSGAHGLDENSEIASDWYYIWMIGNAAANAGLLSNSASAPVMPSGYTYKGLFGAVRNDASSNFIGFTQKGARVSTENNSAAPILTGADFGTSYAAKDITAYVPETARIFHGTLRCSNTSGTGCASYVAYDSTPLGEMIALSGSAGGSSDVYAPVSVLINGTTVSTKRTATTTTGSLFIGGWEY